MSLIQPSPSSSTFPMGYCKRHLLLRPAVDDSEFVSVRPPVGVNDILQQFARRTAAQWRSGQRSAPFIVGEILRPSSELPSDPAAKLPAAKLRSCPPAWMPDSPRECCKCRAFRCRASRCRRTVFASGANRPRMTSPRWYETRVNVGGWRRRRVQVPRNRGSQGEAKAPTAAAIPPVPSAIFGVPPAIAALPPSSKSGIRVKCFQRERKIFRGLETLLRLLLQAAPHDALQPRRQPDGPSRSVPADLLSESPSSFPQQYRGGRRAAPEIISYNTAPKAKMSVRESTAAPRTCSGAI